MDEYIGIIKLFAGNYAPPGWALCNGQLLQIAQHSNLFHVLGTTYGGDGVNTFALPDLRGRMPVGTGQGPSLANYTAGQVGGAETTTLTANQLPVHSHALLATDQFGDSGAPTGAALASTDDPNTFTSASPIYKQAVPNTALATSSIGPAGGSQPHDNMPPFLGLNYIICLEGMYPPRP